VTDRLLTADDVAEFLSVPVSWVREHTRTNTIPHLVLGRYVRYRRDDVLAWLDTLAAGGGPRFRRYTPGGHTDRAGHAEDVPAPAPGGKS
jgi:excisionase family DNA binding protein